MMKLETLRVESQKEINKWTKAVTVTISEDEDGKYIVGTYTDWDGSESSKIEKVDVYFGMGIFTNYFKSRCNYLNLSMESKRECFNKGIHPERV